jgi:hypothetical protein
MPRLVALATALLALSLLAGPASAAKPQRCANGKVRLVAGAPCVAVKRGPVVIPAAIRGDARFRELARPRAVQRAAAVLKAATAIRARAARAQDGEWEPTEIKGLPGRAGRSSAARSDQASEQCTREGYGGDYGHIDGILAWEPYEAHVTVTPEQPASGDFTVAVRRDGDFEPNCRRQADAGTCTETGDMTGTVHFVRR